MFFKEFPTLIKDPTIEKKVIIKKVMSFCPGKVIYTTRSGFPAVIPFLSLKEAYDLVEEALKKEKTS